MKKILKTLGALILLVLGNAPAFATDYQEFSGSDAAGSTSQQFEQMEAMVTNGTLFFGVIVVLAILVTGFFLGRKWLRRVG